MGTFKNETADVSIDYNVLFDLTSSPKMVVTDNSTYNSGDSNGVVVFITVTRPDGIVRKPTDKPDMEVAAETKNGDLNTFEFTLPLSPTDGKVARGTYKIEYSFTIGDATPVVVKKTINFAFSYIELSIQKLINEFTPEVKVKDTTPNYTVTNFTLKSLERTFSASNPVSGSTISDSTTTGTTAEERAFDIKDGNGLYFDTQYSSTLEIVTNHEHKTYSWFTVKAKASKTETVKIFTVPTEIEMLSFFDTIRNQMETYEGYNLTLYNSYKKDYEFILSSHKHLLDRIQQNKLGQDTTEILRDILDVIRKNVPRTHTNSALNSNDLKDFLPTVDYSNIGNIPKYNPFETYEKEFATPGIEWEVIHSLNKKPTVTLVDDYENIVYGAVEYVNLNIIKITFTSTTSGKVYLN